MFLGTDVVDGDMLRLLDHRRLAYVAFTRKRHFSHAEAEINRALEARREEID